MDTTYLPLSVGVFIYRDFATDVLFGDQWHEAADIIGVMSLALALRILFVRLYNEAYRARGLFRLPFVLQIVDVVILVPACLIAVKQGFWPLVYTRALVNLDLLIPQIILGWVILKISLKDILSGIAPLIVSTAAMAAVGYGLQTVYSGFAWNFVSIAICVIVYFGILFLFKKERERLLLPVLRKFRKKLGKRS